MGVVLMSRYYSKIKKQRLSNNYKQAIKAIGGLKTYVVNGTFTTESIYYKEGVWWLISKKPGHWSTTPIQSMYF